MCDSDTRDQNRLMNRAARKEVPLTDLPHVRIDMPLKQMNGLYVQATQIERVLREGEPLVREKLALRLVRQLMAGMDDASGGFLAPRNV
jgi:hypothetical protein